MLGLAAFSADFTFRRTGAPSSVLLFTVLSGEGGRIPRHILAWKIDYNLEVNVLKQFYKFKQTLTFALDPILLGLHLLKYIRLVHNSTCHLSVSGTFAVLQVPRLRAAFPVFPRRHAPSAEEDLQGAVWVPAHGLKLSRDSGKSDQVGTDGLLLESPNTYLNFYRYFRSVVLGHCCYLKFIFCPYSFP